MLTYYAKLAALSIKRNPILSGLMMLAIAVGIGAFMTTYSVMHIMGGNPIWYKNDQLYTVHLDTWNPERPRDSGRTELAPEQLTYMDAMALEQSDIPSYSTPMFKMGVVVQPENLEVAPYLDGGRMTKNDFFEMFDVPFLYGSAWNEATDESGDFVTVLSKKMNDKVFGGENSVGRTIRMDDYEYTVVGVLDDWEPRPKYYDLTNGSMNPSEAFYLPFELQHTIEPDRWGNTNCWKNERLETYQDFLAGACVWLQYWVQLDTPSQQQDYRDYLAGYVAEQQEIGRVTRPENTTIWNPEEWMRVNQVMPDDVRVLVALSALFLVVCLLNTVGLLLAKFMGRTGEISVRRALGASRWAIFRQQMAECGFIGVVGGLLGIGVTAAGLQLIKILMKYDGPVDMDVELISIAIGVSILASLAAGLWPSFQICRVPPAGYLKTQ
ncbi:MAG: ABC transporter permease [Gammaproteobacteria bacterium]|nr:ABC transporter permease [Gammaproteobacteria bacterium]